MSNKKKSKAKSRLVYGVPGSKVALDEKGRAYYIPDGIQEGATLMGERRKRGLDGTYADTCLGCVKPTDTGLGIRGIAEAHLAFLQILGMTPQEALGTAQVVWRELGIWDGDPEHVPGGVLTEAYRVCGECAPRGMEVRELHGPIMLYIPPPEPDDPELGHRPAAPGVRP